MKKRSIIAGFVCASLLATLATGCGGNKEPQATNTAPEETPKAVEKQQPSDEKKVISMLVFSNNDKEYFQNTINLTEEYKKHNPNITVEIQLVKDNAEFENSLKIRKNANELPDLMPLKAYMLETFKEDLADLSDTNAVKTNKFAHYFEMDGKITGVPQISFNEFVYYRKSIFQEKGLEPPKTWDDFKNIVNKLNEDKKYIPIAMGAKDAWPDYPFNEYIPFLEASDGALWNKMGTMEAPFAESEPLFKATKMIEDFYATKPFGDDPLGIGWEQAKSLFISGKASMIAAGQWFIPEFESGGGDMNDLGVFLMPYRANASDKLNTIGMVDMFLSTPANGKNLEESKEFIDWFFSSDFYPGYITAMQQTSTVEGIETDIPLIKDVLADPSVNYVMVENEDEYAKKLRDTVQFDPKVIGQEMLSGKSVEDIFKDLAAKWQQ